MKETIATIGKGLPEDLTKKTNLMKWADDAGLNFKIKSAPVRFNPDIVGLESDGFDYPDRQVLYRDDTGAPMAIVSDKYQIVQPEDILDFFHKISSTMGFKMLGAGSASGGRRIWALADTGNRISVAGTDEHVSNLLMSSGCDGKTPTVGKYITRRLSCSNQLTMRLKRGENVKLKMPHSTKFNPDAFKVALDGHVQGLRSFEKNANRMVERKVTIQEACHFFLSLFQSDREKLEGIVDATQMKQGSHAHGMMKAYMEEETCNTEAAAGTAFGLLNAVTYHFDHGTKTEEDNRFWKTNFEWFDKTKTKAYDKLIEVSKANQERVKNILDIVAT